MYNLNFEGFMKLFKGYDFVCQKFCEDVFIME